MNYSLDDIAPNYHKIDMLVGLSNNLVKECAIMLAHSDDPETEQEALQTLKRFGALLIEAKEIRNRLLDKTNNQIIRHAFSNHQKP